MSGLGASWTLAIELSNPSAGKAGERGVRGRVVKTGATVALGRFAGGALEALAEEHLRTDEGRRLGDDLLPAIERVAQRAGISAAEIDAIGVSAGPGGFTGVRIAVTAGAVLGERLGAKVHAVPSWLVAAWAMEDGPEPAAICVASKREECVVAVRAGDAAWWSGVRGGLGLEAELAAALERAAGGTGRGLEGLARRVVPIGVRTSEVIRALRAGVVVGDGYLPASFREEAARAGARVEEPVFGAAGVLELTRVIPGEDAGRVRPIYGRRPEAVRLWETRHGEPGSR